jgi:ABC-type lipoprotein release transport system permease subunit
MVSQREAVFVATIAALSQSGINFVVGESVIHDVMTKEIRSNVVDRVCTMFQAGEVAFKDTDSNSNKLADAKELRKYVNGLVTNWHNKDKALNAGAKYETKNPGSRVGAQDEQIKEMKNLQKHLEAAGNTEGALKVAEAITARLEELRVLSSTKRLPTVDTSKLPEELRALIEEIDSI